MNSSTNTATLVGNGTSSYFGNGTLFRWFIDYWDDLTRVWYASYGIATVYFVSSTIVCGWFASAILTSTEMRKGLRNQLLCLVTLVQGLTVSISELLELVTVIHFKIHVQSIWCHLYSFCTYYRLIMEFLSSWYFVILIIVYIAQIMDYDMSSTLTPRARCWGKVALLTIPAVLSLILLPAIASPFISGTFKSCLFISNKGLIIFRILDYLIPLTLSVVLLAVASVLYYRRFHRGIMTSRNNRPDLMGRGSSIDTITPYIVAVGIDIAFRFCDSTLYIVELDIGPWPKLYIYSTIARFVADFKVVLMPFAWLFLDDVRERVKVWRPWKRSAPDGDQVALSVTFSRNELGYE